MGVVQIAYDAAGRRGTACLDGDASCGSKRDDVVRDDDVQRARATNPSGEASRALVRDGDVALRRVAGERAHDALDVHAGVANLRMTAAPHPHTRSESRDTLRPLHFGAGADEELHAVDYAARAKIRRKHGGGVRSAGKRVGCLARCRVVPARSAADDASVEVDREILHRSSQRAD